MKREFCTYEEAAALLDGDSERIRQMLLRGEIAAFVELHFNLAECSTHGLDLLDAGQTADNQSEWWHGQGASEYVLYGWFQVSQDSLRSIARLRKFEDRAQVWPAGKPWDGFEYGDFSFTVKGLDNSKDLSSLWFRVSELRALKAQDDTKPNGGRDELDSRERTTLLTIIGALAEEAKVDLSQHIKAGDTVAKMLEAKGVKLSGRTIGEHLKAVRKAMDSRKDK